MIKGIIFDLDGTLIDTIGDITYSANLTLEEFGYEIKDEAFVKSKLGRGFRNLIKEMCPNSVSEEEIDHITKRYAEIYAEHFCEKTKAYEGIYDVLLNLQEKGIKMGVNSNKRDAYCKVLMNKLFPKINFVSIIGERENLPIKPDPSSCLEIVKNMALNIAEVILIGDSEVDVRMAKNANLKSIACLWGFRSKDALEKENPTYIISKPKEIINIIEKEK